MSKALSVHIVEDDMRIRNRLMQAIEGDERLCLTASSGLCSDAKKAMDVLPDVLLVDLGLPDGDGEDLITLAERQSNGAVKCIVFSVFGDEKRVVRAMEAGASGYLLKDTDIQDIPQAIMDMVNDNPPISPAIARHLLKRFYSGKTSQPHQKQEALSARETEVLEYVSKGYTAKEVAEYMGVSYHTVIAHTKKIYKKLNVRTRSAAVFEAHQTGVIDVKGAL